MIVVAINKVHHPKEWDGGCNNDVGDDFPLVGRTIPSSRIVFAIMEERR